MKTAVKKKKAARSKKPVRKTGFKDIQMHDLDKDPYFIKKAEEAKAFLRSTGMVFDEEY